MTRQTLTKTERIIYQAFIAAYLLFIIVVVGAVLYGSVNTLETMPDCPAQKEVK